MSMTPEELVRRVRAGIPVDFAEVMAIIAAHYAYRPACFRNGLGPDPIVNEAGTNEGSCKIFYFAQLFDLDPAQTLALFGDYYRRDVLGTPSGANHANIRRFMRDGWGGIHYDDVALARKSDPSESD